MVVGSRAGVDLLEGLPGAKASWRWAEAGPQVPHDFTGKAYNLQILSMGTSPGQVLAEALWLDPTPEITREHLKLAAEVQGLQGVALDAFQLMEDSDLLDSLNLAHI